MLKIIVKLLSITFFLIVLSVIGFAAYYNLFQKTHVASYIDKFERLKSLQNTTKAVFIGGSASHFGIHSELFQRETGIQSVNMALHAGGSFKMYMDNVIPYLKNGDIVFLCPEYEYYSSKYDNISDVSIDLIYMSNNKIFKNTTIHYKIRTIPETLIVGWRHLGNVIKYYVALFINREYSNSSLGDYRRDYSNEYGDYVGIKDLSNRSFVIDHSTVYQDKGFTNNLTQYIDLLNKNGITLYLLFPPVDHSLFESSASEIHKIYSKILLINNVNILFSPEEVIYNDNDFFNTYYHLNYNSAVKYTEFIIDKYKNY